MTRDENKLFFKMVRGAMIAFAAHVEKATASLEGGGEDSNVEPRECLKFDFLELFYAACEREGLPKSTAKEFKVRILDVLGFM